jgi:hypothetical protein
MNPMYGSGVLDDEALSSLDGGIADLDNPGFGLNCSPGSRLLAIALC